MKSQTLRKTIGLASAAVLALMLMPTIAAAQDYSAVQSNGNLHLRGYGSFFVPGTLALCPPGSPTNATMCSGTAGTTQQLHMINQMYVQFMLPQEQSGKKTLSDRHRARLLLEHKVVADHTRWTDGL